MFTLTLFLSTCLVYADNINLSIKPISKDILSNLKDISHHSQIIQMLEHINNGQEMSKELLSQLDVITTAFQNQRCLLLLDNYKAIDVPQFKIPTILRRLVPAIINFTVRFENNLPIKTREELTWTISSLGAVDKKLEKTTCLLSKNLNSLDKYSTYNDYCNKLDNKNFIWKTIPSNCFAQISLFPPKYLMWGQYYSYEGLKVTLQYPFGFNSPLSSRSFHLFVSSTKVLKKEDALSHILSIRPEYTRSYPYTSDNFIMLLQEDYNGQLYTNLSLTVLCILCDPLRSTQVSYADLLSSKFIDYSYPKSGDAPVWSLTKLGISDKTQELFRNGIKKCGQFEQIEGPENDLSQNKLNSPTEKIMNEYIGIWGSVMKNHSMIISHDRMCRKGKTVNESTWDLYKYGPHIHLYSGMYTGITPQIYTIAVVDKLNGLKFVSYGDIRNKPLAYGELVNVFDEYVWALIVVFTVSTAIIAKQIQKRSESSSKPFIRHLETLVKMLLEQDNSHGSHRNENGVSIKILTTSFALASIVLSEAYRNDNVYRMILPRKIITIDKFDQLLKEKIPIFTRSSSVRFPRLTLTNVSGLDFGFHFGRHTIYEKASWARVDSEVKIFDMSSYESWVENKINALVASKTELHMGVKNIMQDLIAENEIFVRNLNISLSDQTGARRLKHEEMTRKFHKQEEQLLLNQLINSKKSAVVLPTHVVHEFASKLKNNRGQSNGQISIGKEIYFSGYQVFKLEGPIPPFLRNRVRGIEVSGILNWLSTLVSDHGAFDEVGNLPRQATMNGNISVVFVVMMVWNCISLIYFTVEYIWYRSKINKSEANNNLVLDF